MNKTILAPMIMQFYLRKMNTKNSSVLAVTIAAIMLVGGMIAVISVADADAQRRARGGDGGSDVMMNFVVSLLTISSMSTATNDLAMDLLIE